MILYHGTTEIIKKPLVSNSKKYLDFGRGFYLTIYREQAEKWALRKAVRQGKKPVVNVYELLEEYMSSNVLNFENEDEKWLDFVCQCRKGNEIYKNYDIIIGNVANDDVFKTVDMYFRGLWDKERTISELRYYKKNNQVCIVKQEMLEKYLVFKEAYNVEA